MKIVLIVFVLISFIKCHIKQDELDKVVKLDQYPTDLDFEIEDEDDKLYQEYIERLRLLDKKVDDELFGNDSDDLNN